MLAVLVIYVSLIFPIFLGVKINLSKERKRLEFCFKIFRIKIICGYAEIIKEGIIIHLTKKFAFIVPFHKIFDMRKKVEPLKDYHFIKMNYLLDIGSQNNATNPVVMAVLVNYFSNHLKWFLNNRKPYVSTENVINVYIDQDRFELPLDATVIFNLLMILLSAIKILVGKISYAIAK